MRSGEDARLHAHFPDEGRRTRRQENASKRLSHIHVAAASGLWAHSFTIPITEHREAVESTVPRVAASGNWTNELTRNRMRNP